MAYTDPTESQQTNEVHAAHQAAPEVLAQRDIDVLRRLAEEQAACATDPVNRERAQQWTRLNDLDPVRPMVWINEIPWHEMDVDDELALRCEDPWAQAQEREMRRMLYQWRHLQTDMVVRAHIACPLAIEMTPIIPEEDVDVVRTDAASDIVSRSFHAQIVEPEDLDLIRQPEVIHNEVETDRRFSLMQRVFGDILPIRKTGRKGIWFTPWDHLIRLWGVQQAMLDLMDRPEMVNEAVARYVAASVHMLDRWEALHLLTCDADNTRIGSGGYGYTTQLPGEGYDPAAVKPQNMWGCSNAQVFSEVSPDMHWEFALRHGMPWLRRWGLTYYGCCEPLHHKLHILRRIPNLRKISMSPRADLGKAAEASDGRYVLSYKPNPAILAEDGWAPDRARRVLREALEEAEGASVEIIMKDISTVRYAPERLWEWADIAMDEAQRAT